MRSLVHNFTVFTGICLLSLMCAFPPMLTAIRKPIKSQCQELHLWGRSNATPPLHNTAAKNFRKTMACTHRTDMGEIFSKYLLPGDIAIALAAYYTAHCNQHMEFEHLLLVKSLKTIVI